MRKLLRTKNKTPKAAAPSTVELKVNEYNRRFGSSKKADTPGSTGVKSESGPSVKINVGVSQGAKPEEVKAFLTKLKQSIREIATSDKNDEAYGRTADAVVEAVDKYETILDKKSTRNASTVGKDSVDKDNYEETLGKSFRILQKGIRKSNNDYENTLGKSFRNLQKSFAKKGKAKFRKQKPPTHVQDAEEATEAALATPLETKADEIPAKPVRVGSPLVQDTKVDAVVEEETVPEDETSVGSTSVASRFSHTSKSSRGSMSHKSSLAKSESKTESGHGLDDDKSQRSKSPKLDDATEVKSAPEREVKLQKEVLVSSPPATKDVASLHMALPLDETKTIVRSTPTREVVEDGANEEDTYVSSACNSPGAFDDDLNEEANVEMLTDGENIIIGFYQTVPGEDDDMDEDFGLSDIVYNLTLLVDGVLVKTVALGAAGIEACNCGALMENDGAVEVDLKGTKESDDFVLEKLQDFFEAVKSATGMAEQPADSQNPETGRRGSETSKNNSNILAETVTTEEMERADDNGRNDADLASPALNHSEEEAREDTSGEKSGDKAPPPTEGNRWSAAFDKKHNRYYYYNEDTKERSWEKPKGFDDSTVAALDVKREQNVVDETKYWKTKYDTSTKKNYYYNKKTREVSWTKPQGLSI